MIKTIREAFDRWKGALVDQNKQTTPAARHRAHARVTSMEVLIAETPADDMEGVGIKSAYKDCVRVVGRDLLTEVKSLMPESQQGM